MELSKFNWLRCSSNTCSSRLAKIDTPPVSFFNCKSAWAKRCQSHIGAEGSGRVGGAYPRRKAANCGLFKLFLLKHYRAGNDMKYAYIEREREIKYKNESSSKSNNERTTLANIQKDLSIKTLRFPWEQRHSERQPTNVGDFSDGGFFPVPIRSIASNSEFLYNAFESIRLPMLGALLASGKKRRTHWPTRNWRLLNFRCEEVESSKKFLGLEHMEKSDHFPKMNFPKSFSKQPASKSSKTFTALVLTRISTYLNCFPIVSPIDPKTWNTWFLSSYEIPFKFPPLLPF